MSGWLVGCRFWQLCLVSVLASPGFGQADFSVEPATGTAPLEVQFTDLTPNALLGWTWNFGDNSMGGGQNPVHVYDAPGSYTVTFTLLTTTGPQSVSKPGAVVVEPVEMVPAFSMTPVVGGAPLEVSFQNLSTGQEPTNWSWKANGWTIGSNQDLTHVFETTGSYDITLTMSYFGQQESLTIEDAIQVLPTLGFLPPAILGAGQDPSHLELGDVSGDGTPDVLVSSSSEPQVRALLNDGAGGFSTPVVTTMPAPVTSWAVGDMDGDARADIVAVLDGAPMDLNVLLSGVDGTFQTSAVLSLAGTGSEAIRWASILDADEDGANDVAVARLLRTQVVYGDGRGGLLPEPSEVPVPVSQLSSVVVPLQANSDEHVDLLTAGFDNSSGLGYEWDVVLGNGQGVFTAQSESITGSIGYGFGSVATGDVTGDGFIDAVASDWDYLALARGTDAGLMTDPADQFAGGDYGHMATGDLDSDGDDEVVGSSTNHGDPQMGRLDYMIGAGSFPGSFQHVDLHSKAGDVAVGDLDGDGVDDVVTLHPLDGTLSILFNRTAPPGWTDVGNGLVGATGEPVLSGLGSLQPGSEVELALTNARRNAPCAIFVGLQPIEQPFMGGTLVPSPDALLLGISSDANGQLLIRERWPQDVGPGLSLWYQVWVLDPAGPQGAAASNGLASKS